MHTIQSDTVLIYSHMRQTLEYSLSFGLLLLLRFALSEFMLVN